MTAITHAISSALLHFVWQGIAVAGLLCATLFLLRKRSANARYVAACGGLFLLALMPVATLFAVYQSPVSRGAGPIAFAFERTMVTSFVESAVAGGGAWFDWIQSWTLTAWSAGVLLFSSRIVWSCSHVYALKRSGQMADEWLVEVVRALAGRLGIRPRVGVLISSMADGPSVVGWLRPVVLLPAATVLGLTSQQLEAVLAHELAHIRRHDYFVSTLQTVVETLLFYHPAVWWTSNRIRHERELCCDDLAVRSCGDALCYARALTKLERIRVMKPSIVLGSTDGSLTYRVRRLIGLKTPEYGPSRTSGILVLLVGAAALAVNFNWANAESPRFGQAVVPQVQDQAGVTVDLGASLLLHRTHVDYPEAAIEKGIQGTVSVEVTIDPAGNVLDARVLTGPPELRKRVLESVLQWHFAGDAVQSTRVIHITFDSAAARPQAMTAVNFVRQDGRFAERAKAEREAWAVKSAVQFNVFEVTKAPEPSPQRLDNDKASAELLKKRLAEAEKRLEFAKQQGDANVRAKLQDELVKLREAIAYRQTRQHLTMSGRVLSGIRILGLSEQSQQELLSRLPVRVGDVLSGVSMESTLAAIRLFDEHLQPSYRVSSNNNGVELRILTPGSGAGVIEKLIREKQPN